MTFDLRSLQHFITVAECGGFARAARQLRLSQPSLSRSIMQLEEVVGAKLFSRDTRGTAITQAGRRFLPHAVSILNEVQRARDLFDSGEESPVEQIRIGVSPSLLHHGLPNVLKQLLQSNPRCGVVVVTGTREWLSEAVRSREIDVSVCLVAAFLTQEREQLQGLQFEEIATETVIPVAVSDHPVFAEPVTLDAASQHGWAVPHQMSVSYRFETAFFRRGLAAPQQRLNCASMSLLREAICDWRLLALAPRQFVAGDIASGRLRALELGELNFSYSVTILTAKDALLPPACKELIDAFRREVGKVFAA
jgi:LysR family pca operon transcriptional activator